MTVNLTRSYTPAPIDLIAELRRLDALASQYEADGWPMATEEIAGMPSDLRESIFFARSALSHAGINPDRLGNWINVWRRAEPPMHPTTWQGRGSDGCMLRSGERS